jgi:hypothetical protein
MTGTEEVIREARDLNESIRVLARTAYVREVPTLKAAGAEVVFSSEGELALAFTEAVLRELGATPEQIDRERDRVRSEVLHSEDRPTEAAISPTIEAVAQAKSPGPAVAGGIEDAKSRGNNGETEDPLSGTAPTAPSRDAHPSGE